VSVALLHVEASPSGICFLGDSVKKRDAGAENETPSARVGGAIQCF
jgi:hypothetical protein